MYLVVCRGFLSRRTPNDSKKTITMRNKKESRVEVVGTYRLVFDTRHVLDLDNTFLVPNISRNLISVSILDCNGFNFNFGHGIMHIFSNNILIVNGYMCDGLYRLKLVSMYEQTLHTPHINCGLHIGLKRGPLNENSSRLWHKRLGHISEQRT